MRSDSSQRLPPEYSPRMYLAEGASRSASLAAAASRAPGGEAKTSAVEPSRHCSARRAASSRVPANDRFAPRTVVGSPPRNPMTTGLPLSRARARTRSATARWGGLETRTMTLVSGSSVRSCSASRVVRPPTASFRSRPPVPIAWLIPLPPRCTRTVTSWSPVPDPATTPIGPRRTRFAKPRATPSRMAVPAPGPMRRRRRRTAASLRSRSSSTETLSLNSRTLRSASRACAASSAANSPATEITAISAPPRLVTADLKVRLGRGPVPAVGLGRDASARSSSARDRASWAVSSSAAFTATIRSSARASVSCGASRPASESIRRFASVPMPTIARVTPGNWESSADRRIKRTESWYRPGFKRTAMLTSCHCPFHHAPGGRPSLRGRTHGAPRARHPHRHGEPPQSLPCPRCWLRTFAPCRR